MFQLKGQLKGQSRFFLIISMLFWAGGALERSAEAGVFEVGAAFAFNKSTYGSDSFSWSRRWTGSLAYHLSDVSSIEAAYEDAVQREKIIGYQDTTYHDKVYSVSWVQALLNQSYMIQPFVKGGAGQLNRDSSGTYANGATPASRVDSLTVILGGGLRLFLTQHFVIRAQVTSYLEGGRIRTYKDNVATSLGISVYF